MCTSHTPTIFEFSIHTNACNEEKTKDPSHHSVLCKAAGGLLEGDIWKEFEWFFNAPNIFFLLHYILEKKWDISQLFNIKKRRIVNRENTRNFVTNGVKKLFRNVESQLLRFFFPMWKSIYDNCKMVWA